MRPQNASAAVLAYQELQPGDIIDAVESLGYECDGRMLALNSYENRVYQVGIEGAGNLVAKFYRPARWSDAAILEEHAFSIELAEDELPVHVDGHRIHMPVPCTTSMTSVLQSSTAGAGVPRTSMTWNYWVSWGDSSAGFTFTAILQNLQRALLWISTVLAPLPSTGYWKMILFRPIYATPTHACAATC